MSDPKTDAAKELAEQIYFVLRRHVESGRAFSWSDAADMALVQVARPGRPGAQLTPQMRETLRQHFMLLTHDLSTPAESKPLMHFCQRAAEAALARVPRPRHPGARLRDPSLSMQEMVKAALFAEWSQAVDDDDLVRRALTRALRERRKSRRHLRRLQLESQDPLRSLLGLPEGSAVFLPWRDLRLHLASARNRAGQDQALPGLLRQAARFSERTLRPALGEELWAICLPVGFVDPRMTRVSVQVRSSALAHEVSMRRVELLARLRQVPGFEQVRDIRFLVEEKRMLLVQGKKTRPMPPASPKSEPMQARDPVLRAQLARFIARGSLDDDNHDECHDADRHDDDNREQ